MDSNQSLQSLHLLEFINKLEQITRENKSVNETLIRLVDVFSQQVAHSIKTKRRFIRIIYQGVEYKSSGSEKALFCKEDSFNTKSGKNVYLQYCVSKEHNDENRDNGNEQNHAIASLKTLLSRYLNSVEQKNISKKPDLTEEDPEKADIISSSFLQKFLNKDNYNRDIYHDLTPFKVREVLLISSLYDAYAIEREGRFTEHMLGQYGQLNLLAHLLATLGVISQAFQHPVQMPRLLPGFHGSPIQLGKNIPEIRQACCQRMAFHDFGTHSHDDAFYARCIGLFADSSQRFLKWHG